MSHQPKRGLGWISIAIIIAALEVSASIVYAASSHDPGTARTLTRTVTESAALSSSQLHKVTFNDTGESCGGILYVSPWAVAMGNITIAQPSNVTLPLSGVESESGVYNTISKIIFTVPNGSYNYNVTSGSLLMPYSGTVNVNGADVVVELYQISCYGK